MCRSIKQLRRPEPPVSEGELYEAALQYVRKVSGFRRPSRANSAAFERAVEQVSAATKLLLEQLAVPAREEA